MTTPVDIPEIERLTKELAERLQAITGCRPDVDVWFHTGSGDTRSLAHDAVACGYRVRRVPDHVRPHSVSHIAAQKWVTDAGMIYIHVKPRKARKARL